MWNPHKKGLIDKLERVQRRATKMINGYKHKSYIERLHNLNLPTLKYRRMRGEVIEFYKITKNLEKDSNYVGANLVKKYDIDKNMRGHKYEVHLPHTRRGIRKNSFVFRITKIWNDLLAEVVEAFSLMCFERRLYKFWEHQPMKWNHEEEYKTTWELHKED
jgi:hypothetical protein